jgi:transcriptional regulator with XRE-family HTH domain
MGVAAIQYSGVFHLNDFSRGPADPVDVEIGARIKRYRQAQHLSLAALGEAAGVSFQQIQKYEQGANRIAAATLVRIARRLQISAAYLLGESQDADLEPETVALLRVPGAFALLEAFADIRDPAAREALIRLAEAAGHPGHPRVETVVPFERKSFAGE